MSNTCPVVDVPTTARTRYLRDAEGEWLALSQSGLRPLLAAVIGGPKADEQAEALLRYGARHLIASNVTDLAAVVGPAKAVSLKAALALAGALNARAANEDRVAVRFPKDVFPLVSDMADLEQEEVRVVLLDTRNNVMAVSRLYRGTLDSVQMRISEVFRDAVRLGAAHIIVVHNHPSGNPEPSAEDVRVTRTLAEAGKNLEIDVLDHVIVGKTRCVSLQERGLGFN